MTACSAAAPASSGVPLMCEAACVSVMMRPKCSTFPPAGMGWLWPVSCRLCHWSNDDVVGVLMQHSGCMLMSAFHTRPPENRSDINEAMRLTESTSKSIIDCRSEGVIAHSEPTCRNRSHAPSCWKGIDPRTGMSSSGGYRILAQSRSLLQLANNSGFLS